MSSPTAGSVPGPDAVDASRTSRRPRVDNGQVSRRPSVQQVGQEAQVAAQVAQGDHGDAAAGQGVVGVVPLRPLGVHPDAGVGHQVRQLGQGRHQQLLEQIGVVDRAVRAGQQLAVGPPVGDPFVDARPPGRRRSRWCRAGSSQDLLVWLDAVGHVGVAEDLVAEHVREAAGVVAVQGLEQLQQVDDLVVAPVADVAPGIVGRHDFPVHAVTGDAVGIEAVHGRGVDELGDDAGQEPGEGRAQGFPVLEDVAPVALVVQRPVAVAVADADGEPVPGPAGVAVAPPEVEGQVLVAQALEVGVAGLPRQRRAGRGPSSRSGRPARRACSRSATPRLRTPGNRRGRPRGCRSSGRRPRRACC